ncbi:MULTISPECIES: response regulator [unclassified Vibrio]|uniref:response regulator n=1 Tax=unclassified Vibrio TaxID=2614977 RepID=UPI001360F735|nr:MULTISPECIES: response regulator [unclassified Vibrio]NAW58041.1 response regulator [Vibrio sp. V36_P2S2PM302]NAX21563.1 response regulator [Vibrio sp. V39_P1S14PM300]NAX26289.1 response regulator [Vibrio sp. V38_P2S17PM301]NAX32356.1 response regulator [Vibrio sp. V37_P2S8PM304]
MSTLTRVMIIEDDIAIAQLHHRYLEQMGGFDVVGIATTQAEAEMQLELLKPQLVLLDVYLPDGTGLNILNQLRGENLGCDVILITAARDVETLQTAMRGGVVDYLLKPVMFPRLEAALKKYQSRQQELGSVDDLNQSLVDKMLQANVGSDKPSGRLPKGIDSVTLDKIRALFTSPVSLTADEAGEKIGASRTTARRYLEFLITVGELEADLNYGTVGRPERRYVKVSR